MECKPRWVQLLSDTCAPIQRCETFHGFLADYPDVSFIGDGDHNIFQTPPGRSRKPDTWQENASHPFLKQSQWDTVWMGHVKSLLDREAENELIWNETYCPDEHYTVNILTELGSNITRRSLTYVPFDSLASISALGHPQDIDCPTEAHHRRHYYNHGAGRSDKGLISDTDVEHQAAESKNSSHANKWFNHYLEDADVVVPQDSDAGKLSDPRQLVTEAIESGAFFLRKFEDTCTSFLTNLLSESPTPLTQWGGALTAGRTSEKQRSSRFSL